MLLSVELAGTSKTATVALLHPPQEATTGIGKGTHISTL